MGSISVRLAGLAAVAGLLLAGCSDEPVPQEPDPTPTSAAPSPTLTPPVLPEEAKADTSSGAANFAIHWTKLSEYSSLTGDTRSLEATSDEDCLGCTEYIDLYQKVYGAGGRIEGSAQSLDDISVGALDDPSVVLVKATHTMSPGVVLNSSESSEVKTKASTTKVVFRVERSGDRWLMAGYAADE